MKELSCMTHEDTLVVPVPAKAAKSPSKSSMFKAALGLDIQTPEDNKTYRRLRRNVILWCQDLIDCKHTAISHHSGSAQTTAAKRVINRVPEYFPINVIDR